MRDFDDDAALGEWFDGLVAWDAGQDHAPRAPREVLSYGESPEQFVEIWSASPSAGGPMVVSIHGGYFEAEFDRSLHVPIIRRLLADGFAVANVEYRRIGSGGGLTETVADIQAAVDAVVDRFAPPAIATFGHSAGGYLCGRIATHPSVDLAVPLAAVSDPAGASRAGWDDGSIARWMGADPDRDPARYAEADLRSHLPTGTEHLLVHGVADTVVGVQQSRDYADALRLAGDAVRLIELDGEGHYGFLDPRESAFAALREGLLRWRDGLG